MEFIDSKLFQPLFFISFKKWLQIKTNWANIFPIEIIVRFWLWWHPRNVKAHELLWLLPIKSSFQLNVPSNKTEWKSKDGILFDVY